jgi:hypothetical protein
MKTIDPVTLPHINLAGHGISRLIVGNNPLTGQSHNNLDLTKSMVEYFTMERSKALLRNCEAHGINSFQGRGDRWIFRILQEHRQEGGSIKFICQTASEMKDVPGNIRLAAREGAIAVYHHGTETDNHWLEGTIEQVRETMKAARDAGVAVGVGSHKPEVIEYIEEKGWDVDFYMTAFYNVYKNLKGRKDSFILTGIPVEECFDDADRDRMCATIRKASKTCLAFKILGAGRKCERPADVEAAFKYAFSNIKKTDAVIVGMFPKHRDQVPENASLTRKYG